MENTSDNPTDRLARGETMFNGPGACICGHAKVWHKPRTRLRPCERCDCASFALCEGPTVPRGTSRGAVPEPGAEPTITTADGQQVSPGDKVFNYYDLKWGRIAHDVDCDGWFLVNHLDGTSALLNGERISTANLTGIAARA